MNVAYKKKNKTQETKEKILSWIRLGELKDGDCLLPEPQLARKFGVSIITVRRALKELEQNNSIKRVQGRGTFITHKTGSGPHPRFVKLLTPIETSQIPQNNFFLREIVKGVKDGMYDSQNNLDLLCDFFYDREPPVQEYIAGIIGLMLPPETWSQILKTAPPDIPKIAIHYVPEFTDLNISGIKIDNVHGGYIAVKHLIEHGHKNIGILIAEDSPDTMIRYEGYKKALEMYNICHNRDLVATCKLNDADSISTVRNLIASNPSMTAVFMPGYYLAKNVITAIEAESLEIPQDISLVGYDDLASGDFEKKGITTVKQPLEEMGCLAANMMTGMLEGGSVTVNSLTLLRPQLIVRNSVKKLEVQ
ncbi:MAG: GntR family transcriptional regulator [Victivallales bacterium]